MFGNARDFHDDISKWSVSRVTDMSYIFSDAEAFNGDISKWDVSRVTDMRQMFSNAKLFNNVSLAGAYQAVPQWHSCFLEQFPLMATSLGGMSRASPT